MANKIKFALEMILLCICIGIAGYGFQTLRHVDAVTARIDQSSAEDRKAVAAALAEDQKQLAGALTDVNRNLQVLGGILGTFEKVSKSQQEYWKSYGPKTEALLDQVSKTVSDTDASINGPEGMLKTATASLAESTDAQKAIVGNFSALTEKVTPIIVDLGTTTRALSDQVQIASPKIQASLDNVVQTTADTKAVMSNAAEASKIGLDQLKAAVKPAKKLAGAAYIALKYAGRFLSGFVGW